MRSIFLLSIRGAFCVLTFSFNRHPFVPSFADASVPPLPAPGALPLPPTPKSPPPVPGELLDIDNASPEELRRALKIRNAQYWALVGFVVRMKELHIAAAERLPHPSSNFSKNS